MKYWFLLTYLILASDSVAAFIAGVKLRSIANGDKMIRALSNVFFGLCLRQVFLLIGFGFGYEIHPKPTIGLVAFDLAGRVSLSILVWSFVLYLVTVRKK